MRYVKAIRVAPEDTEKIQNILGMTAKERKEYPPEDITYAICFPNHVEFSIQLHYERKRKYFVEACFFINGNRYMLPNKSTNSLKTGAFS